MHRTQGSRTLWLLLGATLVAAAPVRAQRPAEGASASLVSLQQAAERARAELSAANARLVRFQGGLRPSQQLSEAQLDTLVELRRLASLAEIRAIQANARHMQLRVALAERMRAAQVEASRAPGGPAGYFGVAVSQATVAGRAQGGPAENPRVATVEPGSPAAKAGLRAGDRLIRVGDVVMRDGGDLGPVLRPGNVVRVRFERAGQVQEADVRIEARPVSYQTGVSVTITELPGEQATVRPLPAGGVRVLNPAGPEGEAVIRREVLRGAMPDPNASFVIVSRRTNVVAGAVITQLDDNMRQALGATRGLYVLDVVPGLAIGRAGVRQGDVLVRAGDVTLDAPVDLIRAIQARVEAQGHELRLELVRDRKARTVELKW